MKRSCYIFLLTGLLLTGCQKAPSAEYASVKSIQENFSNQIARLEFYARDFTKYLNTRLLFPPEGGELTDRKLFQIPEIFEVFISDDSSGIGLEAEEWTRDKIVNSSYGRSQHQASEANPSVNIRNGVTLKGKHVKIAVYEHPFTEQASGKVLRLTILFDLDELKSHAELVGAGRAAAKPADKVPAEVQPPPPTSKDAPR